MKIEVDQEKDGRWIAAVPDLPGTMVYGTTREETISRVEALALRVSADHLEHGENIQSTATSEYAAGAEILP